MKKLFVILSIILFFNKIGYSSNEAVDVSKVAEKATFRVLVFSNGELAGTGSGFFINKGGYFITNNHVTQGASKLVIVNKFKKYEEVELIKTYPEKDLSILKVKNYAAGNYLKLQKTKMIRVGHKLFSFGYPGASDIIGVDDDTSATLKDGIVSKITEIYSPNLGYEVGLQLIETSADISGGNSGGPLLSIKGNVVGVNTFKPNDAEAARIFFAISVSEVIKILKENNIKFDISTASMGGFNIIYFILAAVVLITLVVFIVKVQKNNTAGVDKGEISRLIRDKMNKYGKNNAPKPNVNNRNINSNKIVRGGDNKKRVINTRLLPQNKSLPIIQATNKDKMSLGRANGNDIVINNQYLSGNHLFISILGVKIEIVDLGSTNGTYINGKKLIAHQKTQLHKNEKLIIGSEDIVYTIG